jgi:hypothetical protein
LAPLSKPHFVNQLVVNNIAFNAVFGIIFFWETWEIMLDAFCAFAFVESTPT